jgi:hypothetical protein
MVKHARLGVHFDEHWYCSAKCLEIEAQCLIGELRHEAEWVAPHAVPVGRLLVQRHAVPQAVIETALRNQRESGRRLGAELVAMNATSAEDVLRALAAQAGVGYLPSVDLSRVANAPAGLSSDTVRVLRVVPFDVNETRRRISVAAAGPLRHWAVNALREMTRYQIQPFLVPDALLDQLVETYGTAAAGFSPSPQPLRTVPDAAATIARAAQRGVARRMQHVKCDRFVWVRLEGSARPEDFMVALEHPQEERAWQAVPTPH